MKDYYVFNFIELKEDALINNITKVLCRSRKKLINKEWAKQFEKHWVENNTLATEESNNN